MGLSGYVFRNAAEKAEAERFYRKFPSLRPPEEDLVVEGPVLTAAQKSRREILANMFGDWPDVNGETFEQTAKRDDERKAKIARANLTGDEDEVLKSLMDEAPKAEILEYYGIGESDYRRITASITAKLKAA